MNCLIVGGFLGAGKTTFINSVLKMIENENRPMSIALLVNEFGEIPVDVVLIEKGSYSLREITGGCICCTLKGKLKDAVVEIRDNEAPDILILEATGLAVPSEIANDIKSLGGIESITLLCVDPDHFFKLKGKIQIYDLQLAEADFVFITKQGIRDRSVYDDVLTQCETLFSRDVCFSDSDEVSGYILNKELQSVIRNSNNHTVRDSHFFIHQHENHNQEDDHSGFEQITFRLPDKTVLNELEAGLNSITERYGTDLYRIKGIVETEDGWSSLQYIDEGLKIESINRNSDRGSFIVFIGKFSLIKSMMSKELDFLWNKEKSTLNY